LINHYNFFNNYILDFNEKYLSFIEKNKEEIERKMINNLYLKNNLFIICNNKKYIVIKKKIKNNNHEHNYYKHNYYNGNNKNNYIYNIPYDDTYIIYDFNNNNKLNIIESSKKFIIKNLLI
jgi:hypothetical protein